MSRSESVVYIICTRKWSPEGRDEYKGGIRVYMLDTDSLIIPCSRKKAEKSLDQKALNEAVLGNLVP